jgi:hypothetical protein
MWITDIKDLANSSCIKGDMDKNVKLESKMRINQKHICGHMANPL